MGWATPRVRHPEQADRWTWLVVAAYTQLRLARARVADLRLPWERHYEAGRLTPVRVHRVVSAAWRMWARPPSRRNPVDALRGGPKDGSRAGRSATRLSRGRPKSSRRQGERKFCEGLYIHHKTLVLKTQA